MTADLPVRITAPIPAPTPNHSQSLSPEKLDEHRGQIGFEVEVVLSGYWQTDMDPKLRAAVLVDWVDELEDWEVRQIKWGLREWRRENPRRKPNPGDIVGVLKKRRGEEFAARMAALPKPSEPQPVITKGARQRNLARLAELFPQVVKHVPEVKA